MIYFKARNKSIKNDPNKDMIEKQISIMWDSLSGKKALPDHLFIDKLFNGRKSLKKIDFVARL